MAEHTHQWKFVAHIDNCHSFNSAYSCECGATRAAGGERDMVSDPYSVIWLTDDEGGPCCDRCAELLAGAKPEKWDRIEEKAT